jgi:hypothetical protein
MKIPYHQKTTKNTELAASTFSAPPWSQKAVDVITFDFGEIYSKWRSVFSTEV